MSEFQAISLFRPEMFINLSYILVDCSCTYVIILSGILIKLAPHILTAKKISTSTPFQLWDLENSEAYQKVYARSAIPKYDTSALTVEAGIAPSSDPGLCKKTLSDLSTIGEGAYSVITFILADTKGGVAPPDTECGTKYPN
ncbi:514_t:CDS:2, partial [Racocetra persica]